MMKGRCEWLSVHHQSHFGSKLRALTGAERRLLEHRADSLSTAPG